MLKRLLALFFVVMMAAVFFGCARETTSNLSDASKKSYIEGCNSRCKPSCVGKGAVTEICTTKCEEACQCTLDNMAKFYPDKAPEEMMKLESADHKLTSFCIAEIMKKK